MKKVKSIGYYIQKLIPIIRALYYLGLLVILTLGIITLIEITGIVSTKNNSYVFVAFAFAILILFILWGSIDYAKEKIDELLADLLRERNFTNRTAFHHFRNDDFLSYNIPIGILLEDYYICKTTPFKTRTDLRKLNPFNFSFLFNSKFKNQLAEDEIILQLLDTYYSKLAYQIPLNISYSFPRETIFLSVKILYKAFCFLNDNFSSLDDNNLTFKDKSIDHSTVLAITDDYPILHELNKFILTSEYYKSFNFKFKITLNEKAPEAYFRDQENSFKMELLSYYDKHHKGSYIPGEYLGTSFPSIGFGITTPESPNYIY
jgi:hypothetical protein